MHSDDAIFMLGPMFVVFVIAAVIISRVVAKHRERTMMIEKGLASEEIKAMYARDVRRDPLSSLKWGILLVLGGLAVMIGVYIREYYFANDGIIVGMVCLFVGIGLVIFYTIAAKKTSV